ncbi:transporter substrate-binding protein [Palleronia sp. KMU-117]|uniref:transporter substrate-binding protein n=1 Tax=Palleronia sp. KMU-117 TaxID=3434108 RepID=UPI003D73DA25
MRPSVEIGVLFSRSGSYALISEACRKGALSAVDLVNADDRFPFRLVAVERDPRGNVDQYGPLCAEILTQSAARHIVGCVTSWSRKEVIPTLEKCGGALWYPCPYEGFEASDHVVYTHACPNQHLLPLLAWAFPRFGRKVYLTGSNYIWGWEINRVARDRVLAADGAVTGERYLPIGDTDVAHIIEELKAVRPSFVLNSLIGPSAYEFLKAYKALGIQDAHFRPDVCPVLSCNLTECELGVLGDAGEGLISAGPYFRQEDGAFGSSFEAASHDAVRTIALRLAAHADPSAARLPELLQRPVEGGLAIDPETHHVTLPALIAQVRGGRFRVLDTHPSVAPDPYLSRPDRQPATTGPALRVVT